MMRRSRVGLTIGGRQPIQANIAVAQAADDAGFHSVWAGDGGGDVFGLLTAYGLFTKQILLGSSLALWHRPPTVTAGSAAQLHDMTGGRMILGLGPGPKDRNLDWWSQTWDRPIGRMKEYITIVRGAHTTRGAYSYEGEHFHIRDFTLAARRPATPLPIWLGTVGVQMNRLAGRIADGVLFDVCLSQRYLSEIAIPAIEGGIRSAGRERSDITIAAAVPCAIDDDVKAARRMIKRSIASHLPQDYFFAPWAGDGYEAEARRAQSLFLSGDRDGAIDALSDDFAATVGIAGPPDDALRQLDRWLEIADIVVLFPPAFLAPEDEVEANRRRMIELFAGR